MNTTTPDLKAELEQRKVELVQLTQQMNELNAQREQLLIAINRAIGAINQLNVLLNPQPTPTPDVPEQRLQQNSARRKRA